MKKSQKILLCVLGVVTAIACLGLVWITSARVTSAKIYEMLEAVPVTEKTSEISAYLEQYFIDDYD